MTHIKHTLVFAKRYPSLFRFRCPDCKLPLFYIPKITELTTNSAKGSCIFCGCPYLRPFPPQWFDRLNIYDLPRSPEVPLPSLPLLPYTLNLNESTPFRICFGSYIIEPSLITSEDGWFVVKTQATKITPSDYAFDKKYFALYICRLIQTFLFLLSVPTLISPSHHKVQIDEEKNTISFFFRFYR